MNHGERAEMLFKQGYNCAQAVFIAFCDEMNIDEETAAKLASSFGGGMGRMREVCGAVSGMFMVAGMLFGYADPEAGVEKKEHYARIQELAGEFKQQNGSIICRELLGLEKKENTEPDPTPRTGEFYKKRPCGELVGIAAEIMEKYIDKIRNEELKQ